MPVGDYDQSLILVGADLIRTPIWRGTLIHAAGPTRWPLGKK